MFLETDLFKKVINLQRSDFGDYYYVNYGWITKNLELQRYSHVGRRLVSIDKQENKRIGELLNLDMDIDDDVRRIELYNVIVPNLIEKLEVINTEEDLLNYIKRLEFPFSNMIPGIVKKYFNLI